MVRPPIHPGEILADELEEIGLNANQLAQALSIPNNRLYQILSGKRSITADTALRLGQYFGTGAEVWLNLQRAYDLRLAEQSVGETIRRTVHPRTPSDRATPTHQ